MRLFLISALVALGSWYVFVGGRKVDEAAVHSLYSQYWHAFDERDGKKVCELIDEKYVAKTRNRTPAGSFDKTIDRKEACESTDGFYKMMDDLGKKVGAELHYNVDYNIEKIDISPDGKTATVDLRSEIRIGTESRLYLKMNSTQTDIIIRRMGKTKFASSESETTM